MLSTLACVARYLSGKEPGSGFWRVERESNGSEKIAIWDASLGPMPTQAEIDAAALPAVKAYRIPFNRAECERRIYARYPIGRQLSSLAGRYDAVNVAVMDEWIVANIQAENAAADAIEAATTVAAVEAVTVAWPA